MQIARPDHFLTEAGGTSIFALPEKYNAILAKSCQFKGSEYLNITAKQYEATSSYSDGGPEGVRAASPNHPSLSAKLAMVPSEAMSVYRANACNRLPKSNISDATRRIGGMSTGRFRVVRIAAVINILSIGQKALMSTECASPISLTE